MRTLFKIEDIKYNDSQLETGIVIDDSHPIFKGHFPDQPVMPGVCMLEMILAAIEKSGQHHVRLAHISIVKYLSIWTPKEFTRVSLKIDYRFHENTCEILNCVIEKGDRIFLKFKGRLHVG